MKDKLKSCAEISLNKHISLPHLLILVNTCPSKQEKTRTHQSQSRLEQIQQVWSWIMMKDDVYFVICLNLNYLLYHRLDWEECMSCRQWVVVVYIYVCWLLAARREEWCGDEPGASPVFETLLLGCWVSGILYCCEPPASLYTLAQLDNVEATVIINTQHSSSDQPAVAGAGCSQCQQYLSTHSHSLLCCQ